jgi:channel protein (hemolysin III family)
MLGFYQPISSWTHLFAALLTLSTGWILIRKGWGNRIRVASLIVFMIGIVFVFLMSGIYHALEPGLGRQVFRRLDYAAIFTMIAGTATPIHIIMFRGFWRWGMLLFLWITAIVGLLMTIILIDQMPEWLTLTIFISMGWTALISLSRAWKMYGFRNISYAFYGGIAYTLGAAIDFLKIGDLIPGYVGHHEIFHILVIAGAAFHWRLIYNWADQPTHTKLIFMVKEKSENEFVAKAIGEAIKINATSKEELRRVVKETLKTQFHPCLVPAKVRFRYYKDVMFKVASN